MSTLAQLPLTTNAPAIEPSNQPIPSHATYMSKAAGGELGAIAESGISISAGAAAAAVTSNAAEEEKTGSTNAAGTGVRILKKTMSTDSMLDDKSSTAGGQSSSGGGTPSSAKQRKYERKTKRFIWPDELHRLFVAAIFDVGLKNASPKALLGLMGAAGPDSGLTTEHLKSHLQKYRLNYERSRAEFLEFYDHSAKKNLKRRRKNGNKPGEHNTMFVFPISHKKRKGGEGGGDSDDSNSDNDSDDDAVEEMSDSTLEHTTPRGSGAGNSLLERTGSFTSMMQQDPKDPMAVVAVTAAAAYAQRSQQQQLQIQNSMLSNSAMNDPRASFSNSSSSQAQAMAAAYAANQRKASLTDGNSSNNSSNNNRAMAAAAAAAAAFRYPMGLPMGAGAGGPGNASSGGQLGELSDPQWNILSSLMSPHITGMNGGNGGGNVIPTSEGMNGGGGANGGDQFQLHDESNDLQLQMHLAMQAQMNLHRQMLTRKVEVSQHLINSQHDGNNGNNGGNNNYGLGWGANAQQQQQQQHHHQQQQQRQQHQQQQYFQQDQQQQRAAAAAAAARQVLANSSHHPQMQMNLAANTAGMGNNNNISNQTPRPSLAPRTSNNNNNNLAATTSAMASSSLGMGNTYAAASGQRGGIPTSVGPVDVVNVLLNDNGGPDETLGANLGFDKNSGGNNGPSGATASAAAPVDDDSLDLYRWDRIDLNVELDDDDLFGFLKS